MGAGQSSEEDCQQGYHVIRVRDKNVLSANIGFKLFPQVCETSPGGRAGLQAYFDFIISINGVVLEEDDDDFKRILKENEGKEVLLRVYNSKTFSIRDVRVVPSTDWNGKGLLGVSIRFCTFEGANEHVWHVVVGFGRVVDVGFVSWSFPQDVFDKSPAQAAGLIAEEDYIIGAVSP